MTIKKPMKVNSPKPVGSSEHDNGAVADRFRLDAPDPAAAKRATAGKNSTTVALVFAIAALMVAGILAYTLYRHWEFLMPA